MKLCSVVLFTVLVAVVCADHGKEHKKEIKEMFKKCMEENGVDKETMKSSKDKENPDIKVKCTMDCVTKKMGIIKEDGTFDQAAADAKIANMPEKMQEHIKKAVDECKTVAKSGMGKCESGFQYLKCIHEKMPHRKHKKHSGEDN